jgi:tetraacyldisaccharide-1-P 4'-kinase
LAISIIVGDNGLQQAQMAQDVETVLLFLDVGQGCQWRAVPAPSGVLGENAVGILV